MAGRIDVHHHYLSEAYRKAYYDSGVKEPPGWSLPQWNTDLDSTFSSTQKIKTSILSLTTTGAFNLQGPGAASLARTTNLHGHSITTTSPHKYGFFACIPDPTDSLSAAIDELTYALDTLHADGVTLFTRYGNANHYLGHPSFLPLWAALEKRSAVVFVHPTAPANFQPINPRLIPPFFDFPHETGRAAMDLILNNVIRDHPSVKIILSHAGGTLPFLIPRAAPLLSDGHATPKTAEEMLQEAKSFYFDIALSGNEYTLPLLLRFAKRGHVLFGSDFPFAPEKTIGSMTRGWEAFAEGLGEEERWEVERGNAEGLFPRLRAGGKEGGNGEEVNGEKVNGEKVNGEKVNGEKVNGEKVNGEKVNGEKVNGEKVNGEKVNGF